ncbi:MAG: acetate kinase [Candidatus Delongbacteria bacterium]|nr:acetate kinase [Candidatus Delongbacteria bacterium]
MNILALNCGSSSLKYQVYHWESRDILAKGMIERIGLEGAFINHDRKGSEKVKIYQAIANHKEALELVLKTLISEENGVLKSIQQIDAVGHRMIHGGTAFIKSTRIDGKNGSVLKKMRDNFSLAPLHNPPAVLGAEAAFDLLPSVPHVAVLDTAFHQTMPAPSYVYPLPYEWLDELEVRRYGFHGTSHLYVSRRAAALLGKKPNECNLITCHIGNGVSFTAIKNGLSYDTSMGFTPLEGLVMGTRSGDFDPAIILHVMEKKGYSIQQMQDILNKKSGILGMTGKYVDQRDLCEAVDRKEESAVLAFDVQAYRARKYIGAYAFALGHVDAIVFTAGVGEMSPELREPVLQGLDEFGIILDHDANLKAKNRNREFIISKPESKIKVFVIPTDEEMVFVEDVVAIIENRYDTHDKFEYTFQRPDYVNKIREEALKKEAARK